MGEHDKSIIIQVIANDLFKVRGYTHLWVTDDHVYGMLEVSEGWAGKPSRKIRFSLAVETRFQTDSSYNGSICLVKEVKVKIQGCEKAYVFEPTPFAAMGGEIRYWKNGKYVDDSRVPAQEFATAVERAVLALEWLNPVE